MALKVTILGIKIIPLDHGGPELKFIYFHCFSLGQKKPSNAMAISINTSPFL